MRFKRILRLSIETVSCNLLKSDILIFEEYLNLGENYIEELLKKQDEMPFEEFPMIRWHFIGTL